MTPADAQLTRILADLNRAAIQAAEYYGTMSVDYWRAALLDACELPPGLLERLCEIGAES